MRGGASQSESLELAQRSYNERREVVNPDWEFVAKTATAEAYRDKKTGKLLIGIRGTINLLDWATNLHFVSNNVERTARYKKLRAFVTDLLAKEPPGTKVDLAGHSLGGGLATELKRDLGDVVDEVVTFNGAVQLKDVLDPGGTARSYMRNDPIYQNAGGSLVSGARVVDKDGGHGLSSYVDEYGSNYRQDLAVIDPWKDNAIAKGALTATGTVADLAAAAGVPFAGRVSNEVYKKLYGGGDRVCNCGKRKR